MLEIVCFDISAIFILFILFVSLSKGKLIQDRTNRKLLILIAVTFVAAIFDIAANAINYLRPAMYVSVEYICVGAYHIARSASYLLYCTYIISITDTRHRVSKTVIRFAELIPVILITLIVCTTPMNRMVYYIDENGGYIRGAVFGILYILAAVYSAHALYFITINRGIIGIKRAVSLASCSFFSLAASYIQYTKPQYVVDILGFTLSLLFIVLFIENPVDKTESISSLFSYPTYTQDIRRTFFNRKELDVIHINIVNHTSLEQMFSYSNYCEVVKKLSLRLSDINSKYDGRLYHLKGGKFRVLLDDYDLERTEKYAKELLSGFGGDMTLNDMEFNVAISIMISQCPKDFDTADEFLGFAGTAGNYEEAGKIVYTKDLVKEKNFDLNNNIGKVIEKGFTSGGYEVYYQPIYCESSGKYVSAEALIRLNDDKYGVIYPDRIIPAAEQNGNINKLGMFVIEEVCKLIKSDDFKKTDLKHVSVNLSVTQCLQRNLADQIIGVLKRYDVDPSCISFEITESLASDNQKTFTENINKLAEYGIKLALDDYGTGYSNIITLTNLPIYAVKFDREFVNAKEESRLEDILINSIEMVESLGKTIVAIGVEDEKLLSKLRDAGCDYIQGYYYAKPMRRIPFINFCKDNKVKEQ